MSQSNSHGQSNLAKFAFNIYGTLSTNSSTPQSHEISPSSSLSSSRSKKQTSQYNTQDTNNNRLSYYCDKEIISLSQLNCSLLIGGYSGDLQHHVVIGGKNYLRLLCVSESQQRIISGINLLESKSIYNSRAPNKLINVNTIKTFADTIATGLSNGVVSIYKISPNGQSKVTGKYSDHNRTINSLDFIESENQLLSGSQDGTIKLWDLRSSSTKPVMTVQANLHSDPIRACQYSPHSAVRNKICVLSVHDSGALCKFDLRTKSGGKVYSPEKKWNLHTGPALSLHIHPEKELVVTGGRDKRISIFNYGERQSRNTPQNLINTYGPVVKVRWSTYTNTEETAEEFEENKQAKPNTLYNYDIACLYLNDDPTITIYNLGRKFIPKQIIHSKKPIQNFIWARNETRSRKIWTISKSSTFSSYNLDRLEDSDVSRPIEDLNNIAMTWDNNNDFCAVSQARYDYDLETYENGINETTEENFDAERNYSLGNEELIHSQANSLTASPVDKPQLTRSLTFNPALLFSTFSPVLVARAATGFLQNDLATSSSSIPNMQVSSSRPKLTRNTSQTTQDSSSSQFASVLPPPSASQTYSSPQYKKNNPPRFMNNPAYVIPVSIPIPANDEYVFRKLSSESLVSTPDGFTLVDVCLLNASVAASVGNNRTSQIWRLLAVSIQEEFESGIEPRRIYAFQPEAINKLPQDVQETSTNANDTLHAETTNSNFVESFKSTSTLGSQFGKQSDKDERKLQSKNSSGNLMDMINKANRTNSFSATSFKFKEQERKEDESQKAQSIKDENERASIHSKSAPILISSHPEDLDDENMGSNNSAALKFSPPSVGVSIPSTRIISSSLASSPKSVRGPSGVKLHISRSRPSPPVQTWLKQKNLEVSNGLAMASTSGLSLTLKRNKTNEEGDQLTKAWKFKSLLRKSLDYATLQGDIIFCSTAALLFYDIVPEIISQFECLEWLGIYSEVLQRKRLFVNAINVIKCATADIQEKLQKLYCQDLSLRFYCSNCQALLVNEKSKFSGKGEFGYWYCDECSKLQLQCVYCNEPCKGLAVTVGLKCGHHGHFGCLKEWFIEDQNTECPGGCGYQII